MAKFTEEQEYAIELTKRVLLRPILNLIEGDPHQWSTRPCSTCRTISQMIGEPFGCVKKEEKAKRMHNQEIHPINHG